MKIVDFEFNEIENTKKLGSFFCYFYLKFSKTQNSKELISTFQTLIFLYCILNILNMKFWWKGLYEWWKDNNF